MVSNPIGEDEFAATYAREAYNLALRLTGNRIEAEDLAQDAMICAIKAWPKFKGNSSPSTWLYRIVLNTWKNRLRSQSRRGLMHFFSFDLGGESKEKLIDTLVSPEVSAHDLMGREETAAAVHKTLQKLDPEERAVVVLRDMEDKSYAEISQILGLPEGTIKSRLSRARERLRILFKSVEQVDQQ